MDDTDDQEEDASMEKMADSLSNAATLHGSTKDVDEDSKSGDDFSKETSAADSDTRHSFSLNIPRDIQYVCSFVFVLYYILWAWLSHTVIQEAANDFE